MRLGDLLGMSISSLFKRKVRTILTVLGVIIGTTSIVVMMSLGIGMKSAMLADVENYGSLTAINVMEPGRWGGSDDSDSKKEELHLDDALIDTISHMEHVVAVDGMIECSAILKCKGYMTWGQIRGVTTAWMERQKIPLAAGSYPTSPDELRFIYGNTVLQDFSNERTGKSYWETQELPPIDYMKDSMFVLLDTDRYYSAGQEDENGQIVPMPKKHVVEAAGVVEGSIDEWNQYSYFIFCNIDALKTALQREFKGRTIPGQPTRKNGKPYKEFFYNSLVVSCDTMENVSVVQQQINDMGYQTDANAQWIEQEMQSMNIIQAVLGGIGAVSLFVAAIGITNTMMMSIYERTKEIGIMKVIGCRIRDIQALFLIEAGYIGLIGGALGVGLSYAMSVVINKLVSGSEMLGMGESSISVIPVWLALLSVVFAILIAMLAGFFPSLRAMKLSPLAAIRAE
ncbi:MAG: ABC transporter permease [Lachnospiraceae bacterium]|nr:ABC transporter permease [Lachnospiraceae bacterium]